MTTQTIGELDKLIDRYETYRSVCEPEHTHGQINATMKEIRTSAEKLEQNITDGETIKRVTNLIQDCNNAMYSHEAYIEHRQFVVLETYDAEKKFVVIETSNGFNSIISGDRILACEYDDAMQNREAVLENDYLISIKVSLRTSREVRQLIDQVRKDSGESTLLYDHKSVSTTWGY